MLKKLLSVFCLFTSIHVLAQTGGLNYVKNLGGSQTDMFWSNVLLRNGNLVSVGYTESTDGLGEGNHGAQDCIVVCTSPNGRVLWKQILGGTKWDGYTSDVDTTTDGNIVVGLTAGSSDGDAVGNHGSWDAAFFKYTPGGTLIWSKIYGGDGSDILGSLKATPDGGIIACISSASSNTGDITGTNHGMNDLWMLKLDINGSIQWQQLYGGTNDETTAAVAKATDGGYLFATTSRSVDGNLAGTLPTGATIGASDIWLLHTDAAGNIVWSKTVGGSGSDFDGKLYAYGNSIYLGFSSDSEDRDLQGNIGLPDIALFKYDAAGNFQWKKQYASGSYDYLGDLTGLKGEFLTLTGGNYSFSFAGYPMPPADERMMIFRIDTLNGNILWMKSLGGNGRSQGNAVTISNKGELFVSGISSNTTGDIYANLGGYDGIVLSFAGGNKITGTVFVDLNANNVLDAGEDKPTHLTMESTKEAGTLYGLTSTSNGIYNLEVDTGLYTVRPLIGSNPYYTPVPELFSKQFDGSNEIYQQNIALRVIPNVNDLAVSLTPLTLLRPGRIVKYGLTGYNAGTTTIAAGVLTFIKDHGLSYTGFSRPPAYQSDDSVYWNFSAMAPFDSLNIQIDLIAPVDIPNRTPLNHVLDIKPVAGDSTPANNHVFFRHIVVNSLDPNCKSNNMADSMPLAAVQAGEYIYYTIQFQNLGTASAIDISVKDTLSDKFRYSTMEIVRVSHPVKFSMKNKVATWDFFDINLPDSNTNEALSHGYIQYRIKAKPNLVVGDYINNTAAIYFDFNAPVITENNRLTIYVPPVIVPATPVISPAGNVASCVPVVLSTSAGTGYQWFSNGTAITGATASTYTAPVAGVYSIKVTINGVSSNTSAATTVTLGSIGNVLITETNGLVSVLAPDATFAYTWQKLAGQNWVDLSPQVTGIIYQAASGGDFRVRASKGSCTAVSNTIHWEPPVIVVPDYLKVYPNPAGNFLKIDQLAGGNWRFADVLNIVGKKMINTVSLNNLSEITINTSGLSSGVYILVLNNASGEVKRMTFIRR